MVADQRSVGSCDRQMRVQALLALLLLLLLMRWRCEKVAPLSTGPTLRGLLLRRAGKFFGARCPYYANSDATFQSFRLKLLLAGDVEPNPGTPETAVPTRAVRRAPVTVLSQNVRSLRNKLHTLRSHSTELEKYSVIAIAESWLDEGTTDSELQFGLENHTWFRRDRAGLGAV